MFILEFQMSETFSIRVEDDKAILHLLPILDMSCADELLASLRNGINKSNNFMLDAVEVERISTPCVQVLLAAAFKVEKNGGAFSIINISSGLERGMRDLGLSECLENWRVN